MGNNIFEDLIGKTAISVVRQDGGLGRGESIIFEMTDGSQYMMYHEQDCCESVSIEDIDAPLEILVGSPFLMFEESFNSDRDTNHGDSETWTFYRIGTAKGSLTIRWYGTSNGYYSESAQVRCVRESTDRPTMHSFFN